MTFYTDLGLDSQAFTVLSSDQVRELVAQQLAKKISESQANTNAAPAIVKRTLDNARLAAYVLSVDELRRDYDSAEQDQTENAQNKKTPADIAPELITSSVQINFLTQNYLLTDTQIASILTLLPEIETDITTITNLYAQPNTGDKTIQASFDLLRGQPEHAHFALQGLLTHSQLTDTQLAEIIRTSPATNIEGYDLDRLFLQLQFGRQSFEATKDLIVSEPINLGRHLTGTLVKSNRLTDDELAELITALPDNHYLDATLYDIVRRATLGPLSASNFFDRIINDKIDDDELIGMLVDQRVLNGQQYAQLLTQGLRDDRLSTAQRAILARAPFHPEIKEAFLEHIKENRELNTQAFEIVIGTVGFSDHELAQLLSHTNVRWQRIEAEKIAQGNGIRFGPESLDVIIHDVGSIEFRSPQNLERLLMGIKITDEQTARLLEATVSDGEAYELWDVLAQYGTFGDATFAKMDALSHKTPNLRPSFVTKLSDQFKPYPIPDSYSATLLRATKDIVLAEDIRQRLADHQSLGPETFNQLTSEFSRTANVDLRLVRAMVSHGNLDDINLARLIESTAHAHGGSDIRNMIVQSQPLAPNSVRALAQAMRTSSYPQEELGTLQTLSRNNLHEDGRRILADAFAHTHLAEHANQLMGLRGQPGQGFGYSGRGW